MNDQERWYIGEAVRVAEPGMQTRYDITENIVRGSKSFLLTPEHLKLLAAANVYKDTDWDSPPRLDCKRPFGNSDIESDIFRILEWGLFEDGDGERHSSKQRLEDAEELYKQLGTALAIVLETQSFVPGEYESDQWGYRGWHLVGTH